MSIASFVYIIVHQKVVYVGLRIHIYVHTSRSGHESRWQCQSHLKSCFWGRLRPTHRWAGRFCGDNWNCTFWRSVEGLVVSWMVCVQLQVLLGCMQCEWAGWQVTAWCGDYLLTCHYSLLPPSHGRGASACCLSVTEPAHWLPPNWWEWRVRKGWGLDNTQLGDRSSCDWVVLVWVEG